jgi:oxygen-dependent protoporphyrinogen oxidase
MLQTDAVVLACPAPDAAAILDEPLPHVGELLRAISYPPLAVVCLGFPREQVPHPMNGFGFLVPRTAGPRILGALWTSSLFPERTAQQQVLIRTMIGGARDPEALALDDEQLIALVRRELALIQEDCGTPSFARIFRHCRAIPQYTLGHAERLEQLSSRIKTIPGLFLTGNAYRGIGVNDCVRNAWTTADQLMTYLQHRVT